VRLKNGGIYAVTSQGHAGFAEEGTDIVCAGISALMQALETGLKDVLGICVTTIKDPDVPIMGFEWDESIQEGQIISRTMAKSLESIAESYPGYVEYREIIE
jgi:uncharacterized protein YsxB (DUF464 family)